jgi:hypothetical protein
MADGFEVEFLELGTVGDLPGWADFGFSEDETAYRWDRMH